jgi:hypothetical protein
MGTSPRSDESVARFGRLVAALRDPARYPHAADGVELVETHISAVLLAGEYAYKLKRPVDLGFLDFTTLAARRRFCEEELRLNRRTAPGLYLEVVPITGTVDAPVVGGSGEPVEYAVRMRRFDQESLLDRIARRGELTPAIVDALADSIAAFHDRIARSRPEDPFATAQSAAAPALANFDHLESLVPGSADIPELEALRAWTEAKARALAPVFAQRKADGCVRECHGDLHLGNIALVAGEPVAFDGIEFNDAFRWIDVVSEVAFLAMDLIDRGLEPLAWRFLDRWLGRGGDYGGVAVLRFYLVYRAMVRAKVDCIRAHQPEVDDHSRGRMEREYHEYLALAHRLAHDRRPAIVLMHGLSGSGKTTVAQALLERVGGLRVRSDVERKRLHGLAADARTASAAGEGIYGAGASRRTYDRLADVAATIAAAGYPAIVDATFLHRAERERFRDLAARLGVPFVIVDCAAPLEVLRARVARRAASGGDASEATVEVLERQARASEPLADDEAEVTVTVDAARAPGDARPAIDEVARRLGAAARA